MTPDADIDALCERHGLPRSFGWRLMPLVRRAHASPPEQRLFLMGLVERSFVREAERRRGSDARREQEEEQALVQLAATLHRWQPPGWFKDWARDLGAMDAFEG